MNERNMLDINEVCRLLGTTSRTLRFYEEKGIITSTLPELRRRRQYTAEQIEHIKKVFVLRSLGLPISKIQEFQHGRTDLTDAIAERKAKLIASITAKAKEIRLLDEALASIHEGSDIFARKDVQPGEYECERTEIVRICTDAFLSGDYEVIFSHFSDKMKEYTPLSAFRQVINDTLVPIGDFIGIRRCEHDIEFHNTYYSDLNYERLILRLKFVFIRDRIGGFWMQYVDDQKNHTEK